MLQYPNEQDRLVYHTELYNVTGCTEKAASGAGHPVFHLATNRHARSEKENDDKFCSGADIAGYVLAMEAGRLIGETKICKRTISFEKQTIILGGIGSVATHPDKRLRGVAKATVARAMEMLKDLGCDIAYLCVDERDPRKIALYRSFGFDLLYRPHTYLGKSGKRYTDTDAMIAPVNAPLLYNIVMDGTAPLDIGTGNW